MSPRVHRFRTWWTELDPAVRAIIAIVGFGGMVATASWNLALEVGSQRQLPPRVSRLEYQIDTLRTADALAAQERATIRVKLNGQAAKLDVVICMLQRMDQGRSVLGCTNGTN